MNKLALRATTITRKQQHSYNNNDNEKHKHSYVFCGYNSYEAKAILQIKCKMSALFDTFTKLVSLIDMDIKLKL